MKLFKKLTTFMEPKDDPMRNGNLPTWYVVVVTLLLIFTIGGAFLART